MGWHYGLIAVCAYLIGSLNFGVIVSRLFLKKDLRQMGSGNAGTTNALRVMGPRLAALVFLGDILKGVGAALIGRTMGDAGIMAAFVGVIFGHMFPLYFGFRGGKGVLTTASVLLVFDWRMLAISLGVFIILVILTHYVSLGSIVSASLVPVTMLIFHPSPLWFTAVAVLIAGMIVFLHRGNLRRLLTGTESKMYFRKKT